MKKIIIVIEKTKDFYTGYSDNCEGLYGAGNSIEAVKKDIEKAISLIKSELPESQWIDEIKGEYELIFNLDFNSFLEYYGSILSLASLERITGVNQKQLSNYLNRQSVPRKKQIDRITLGLQSFANELLSISL